MGILNAPIGLPQCHEFEKQQMYVRECYEEYYDYLIESMTTDNKKYIVVTGTPGIGKSVFYLYFFEKYKEANPEEEIIVASFDDKVLRECKVWKDGSFEEKIKVPKNKRGVLHLFDGVPDVLPPNNVAVCFTSPVITWFVKLNKYGSKYREIYMPNWTAKEISDANIELNLNVDETDLIRRWEYFGGTVRFTFENDQDTINRQLLNIETALNTCTSIDNVLACFEGTADLKKIVHRLMHYDVKEMRGVFSRRLKPASNHIAYLMQTKLNNRLDQDRQKLMRWLDGNSKSASFLGWLFESYAHEILIKDVDLPMRGLDAQATATSLKLDGTVGNYTRFTTGDLETIFEDAYHTPQSSTLRSVDSYYFTSKNVLWLFQMTRDVNHDINVEGILELLEKFDKLEDMDNVNLVFVVPSDLGKIFPEQNFEFLDVFAPNLTDEEVNRLGCDKMPGINERKKRKLNDAGLNTIGDLFTAQEAAPDKVSSIRSTLTDFQANRRRNQQQQRLLGLKQYCISLDYSPPNVQTGLLVSDTAGA